MVPRVRHNVMNQHRFSLVALAVVALFLAGCGQDPKTTSGDSRRTIDGIEMTWTRSGGVAGIDITVEVENSGKWTVTDTGQDETREGELGDDKRKELESLVADTDLFEGGPGSDEGCADTFKDRLVFDGLELETDCGEAPNEPFADIVELLGEATET